MTMAQLWLTIWISVWHCHHLWFSGISILLVKPDPGLQFWSLCQICANLFTWIFAYASFGGECDSGTQFSAHLSNSVQIRAIMADLCPKMWFSIWRPPPSWILSDTSSQGKSCPRTLFSVSVSNLVQLQIRSKMAELWPFILFQNGSRRNLVFCTM